METMEKERMPTHWLGEEDDSDAGSESVEEESRNQTRKGRPAREKVVGDWLVRAKGDEESEEDSSPSEDEDMDQVSEVQRRHVDKNLGKKISTQLKNQVDEVEPEDQQPSEPRAKLTGRGDSSDHIKPLNAAEEENLIGSTRSRTENSGDAETSKPKRRVKVTQDPSNPLGSTGLSRSKIPKGDLSKTGVVYISRIPPFMKPATLARYLQPFARHGPVGRIFLTPENKTAYGQRVRQGGNKKRSFVDGWVEFHAKKDAKICAETLNARIVGGKKGGYYHDDVWNMKYLKGFKWNHLTEQIRNEEAERAGRMRAEIRRTKKEDKMFVEAVEKSKVLKGIEESRKRKRGAQTMESEVDRDDSGIGHQNLVKEKRQPRHFAQNKVIVPKSRVKGDDRQQPIEVQRVLSKIL